VSLRLLLSLVAFERLDGPVGEPYRSGVVLTLRAGGEDRLAVLHPREGAVNHQPPTLQINVAPAQRLKLTQATAG
jgi:hypothetical protein